MWRKPFPDLLMNDGLERKVDFAGMALHSLSKAWLALRDASTSPITANNHIYFCDRVASNSNKAIYLRTNSLELLIKNIDFMENLTLRRFPPIG